VGDADLCFQAAVPVVDEAKPMRFARSARRRRTGRPHALAVMTTRSATALPADDEHDERRVWIGGDDRGIELTVVAAHMPEGLLVLHVQRTDHQHRDT
jgi:hypothetical protein